MQLGQVIGSTTSTIKHESLNGFRMLIVQPFGAKRTPEGDPLVVMDKIGAGEGQIVLLNSDGKFARGYMNNQKTPVRWTVIGIINE